MSDLLKEAIADAKAVRETALQNAKMALQEAFTPQLKSMLSAKLREEEPFEDEEEFGGEEEVPGEEVPIAAQDEVPGDEFGGGEEIPVAPEEEPVVATDEIPGDEFGGEEVPLAATDEIPGEEEVIEINGVKYAPVQEESMFEAETHPGEQPEPDGYGP